MIVEPNIRSFICTTAHPEGCRENVSSQFDYVKDMGKIKGCKNVLVIGASTGYGLASRIVSAAGCGAATLGVFYERPAKSNRTASAGWYNSIAFENYAKEMGLYAKSINGDAFSKEIKEQAINIIKNDMDKIDLVVYSLASPRRIDPDTGVTYHSVLKPIGKTYTNKSINIMSGEISEVSIEPATEEEIKNTSKVMGGEDWKLWIDALKGANVLADNVITMAYSYIGPEFTFPVYRGGTIGMAKEHLEETAKVLTKDLADIYGKAYVAVNKALVTQASSAIPVVPLYISALLKVMKEKGVHEGCIEQIYRLFSDRLYTEILELDSTGRIRMDDYEMQADIQEEVTLLFNHVTEDRLYEMTDIEGYRQDFKQLFGFAFDKVDYSKDVEIDLNIPSIKN